MKPNEVNFIIYHDPCCDGFGSAWSGYIWEKLNRSNLSREVDDQKNRITFYPGRHTNILNDDVINVVDKNTNVLIIDYCYDRDYLLELKNKCNKILVLDHHETSMKKVGDLEYCYFDMNKSGCILAWEYFFPSEQPPMFLQYIQDRDLWRWKLPYSREFTTAFYSLVPFDFNEYTNYYKNLDLIDKMIGQGTTLLQEITNESIQIANQCQVITTNENKTVALVSSNKHISEIGEILAKKYDYGFIYFETDGVYKFSIRSDYTKNHTNHSGNLANLLGGGGHPSASGFVWNKSIKNLVEFLKVISLS